MPQTDNTNDSSETALRSALNHLYQESEPLAEELQSRLEKSISAFSGKRVSSTGPVKIDKEAISLAVNGVLACYQAIQEQSQQAKTERDNFDQEIEKKIALFSTPINYQSNQLSTEQRVMIELMTLIDEYPLIRPFLGIKISDDSKAKIRKAVTFRFFNASYEIPQPFGSISHLDHERIAIHNFNKSVVPDLIKQIEDSSQYSHTYSILLSFISRGNFLDKHRLPRFIVIFLTNLVWSLQHPVSPVTNFPCSVNTCIELCTTSLEFLNQILDENHPIQIRQISNKSNALLSFLQRIELHIKELKEAYLEKKSKDINVRDLVTQAHATLRIIDINVFKLIYTKKQTNSYLQVLNGTQSCIEIPHKHAAGKMAHSIYVLNRALNRSFTAIIPLFNHSDMDEPLELDFKFMNSPPRTIIDILIVYCHLSRDQRGALIHDIKATKLPSAIVFANELYDFDQEFIKPIKDILNQPTFFHNVTRHFYTDKEYYKKIALLTAKHFIPMITLLVEDFRLNLNIKADPSTITPNNDQSSASPGSLKRLMSQTMSEHELDSGAPLTGNEQVHRINNHAFTTNQELCTYYQSNLSLLLGIPAPYDKIINELPIYQHSITKTTKFLDKLAEIMEHHRDWLQNPTFHDLLTISLTRVQSKYNDFKKYVDHSQSVINDVEHIKRNLSNMLSAMATELKNNIKTVNSLIGDLTHIVCAPNFIVHQKTLLDETILALQLDYADILDESSTSSISQTPPLRLSKTLNKDRSSNLKLSFIQPEYDKDEDSDMSIPSTPESLAGLQSNSHSFFKLDDHEKNISATTPSPNLSESKLRLNHSVSFFESNSHGNQPFFTSSMSKIFRGVIPTPGCSY